MGIFTKRGVKMKKNIKLLALASVLCTVSMLGLACEEVGEYQSVDDMVSIVTVNVHDEDSSIMNVMWFQDVEVDEVWLRYTLNDNEWQESPPQTGEPGSRQVLISGVPKNVTVTFHIVVRQGDEIKESMAYIGSTWLI